MHHQDESWTHVHDIALVFLALAYSADAHLSDEEVDTISASLHRWKPNATEQEIHEIVMEAASVFFESDAEKEVVLSVRTLGEALNVEQRRQVLEDVMRVAEADGVLLNAEQNLLSVLAGAWDIKATKDRLIEESSARMENDPEWSLMHDTALMYIIMGHSTDGDLTEAEIQAMIGRLGEWEPDLEEDQLRAILRTALHYYGQGPEREDIRDSVLSIKEALSRSQRLIILDDLITIARSDGEISDKEKDVLENLSAAWHIDIRIAY
ncbi:MAG: TerB family tellurite resistance protein [Bacteroidetes bacterium]|nr:TerB family tellurite resistance protein [Verrucomicrobiota bacterium]MDA0873561.1 TerB family tellurite resistance protein [Bacteroidota bacterium]